MFLYSEIEESSGSESAISLVIGQELGLLIRLSHGGARVSRGL